jgi:hypothetical protein
MGSGDGLDGDAETGAHLNKPSAVAVAAAVEKNNVVSAGVPH